MNRTYIRATVIGAALIAGLALAIGFVRMRSGPERLIPLPPEGFRAVIDGKLISTHYNPDRTMVFTSTSVVTGESRELGRENTSGRDVGDISVSRAGIFYTMAPVRPRPRSKVFDTSLASMELRYVPLSGGPSTTLAIDLKRHGSELGAATRFGVVDRDLFWLSFRPDGAPKPAGRRMQPAVPTYRSELMTRSINGGSPRRLAGGFSEWSQIYAGNDAIYIYNRGLNVPQGKSLDLLRFDAAGRKAVLKGAQVQPPPVGWEGRVYWIQQSRELAGLRPRDTWEIHSVRLDGSDRRVVLRSTGGGIDALRTFGLISANGLYLAAAESRAEVGIDAERKSAIYRLRLGGEPALEKVYRMPPNSHALKVDGDYLYFTAREESENLFDWSAAGLSPKRTTVLYRVRL